MVTLLAGIAPIQQGNPSTEKELIQLIINSCNMAKLKTKTEIKKNITANQLKNGLKQLGIKLPHGYEIKKRKK